MANDRKSVFYTSEERKKLLRDGKVQTFTFDELILELRRALQRNEDMDLKIILQKIKRRG